jgi:hypothetical protein
MELVVVQAAAEILPALVEQAIVRLEVLLKEMQEDQPLVDQVRSDMAGAGVVLEQLETDQTVMAGGGSSVGGAGGSPTGANSPGSNGTDGRGGGGGGGSVSGGGQSNGGNGGNGVVIIKIPSTKTATFTGGVTETNSTAGGYTTYIVTATSNTSQTVTFS